MKARLVTAGSVTNALAAGVARSLAVAGLHLGAGPRQAVNDSDGQRQGWTCAPNTHYYPLP